MTTDREKLEKLRKAMHIIAQGHWEGYRLPLEEIRKIARAVLAEIEKEEEK